MYEFFLLKHQNYKFNLIYNNDDLPNSEKHKIYFNDLGQQTKLERSCTAKVHVKEKF